MNWWKKFTYEPTSGITTSKEGTVGDRFQPKISLDEAIRSGEAQLLSVPEKPADHEVACQEPNLSTKPKDIIGYHFGFVCPKKHVNTTFESITAEGYSERRVCQTCGAITKPATVKRTAEAQWENRDHSYRWGLLPSPKWSWSHYYNLSNGYLSTRWTKHEFVRFLDSPKKTVRKK
jgi:hypothetical protein